MHLTASHLRTFLTLCVTCDTDRAAHVLDVAPSTVRSHLAQLERRLGRQLLVGRSGEFMATDAGVQVQRRAHHLLAESARALASGGRLRLALASPLVDRLIQIVELVRLALPRQEIEVCLSEEGRQAELVSTGQADVALAWLPLPQEGPRELSTQVVARERRAVLMHRDDPLARARVLTARDLAARAVPTVPPASGTAWERFWLLHGDPGETQIVQRGPAVNSLRAALQRVAAQQVVLPVPETFLRDGVGSPIRQALRSVPVSDLTRASAALVWAPDGDETAALTVLRAAVAVLDG